MIFPLLILGLLTVSLVNCEEDHTSFEGQEESKHVHYDVHYNPDLVQRDMLDSYLPLMKTEGSACKFNHHCQSGCCLQTNGGNRICSRKALKGERCNLFQLKGGVHVDFCSCASGTQYCDNPGGNNRNSVCLS